MFNNTTALNYSIENLITTFNVNLIINGLTDAFNNIHGTNSNANTWKNIYAEILYNNGLSTENILLTGLTLDFLNFNTNESKIISKVMPKKFSSSDGTTSFMLGRRAFSEKIHKSYVNDVITSQGYFSNEYSSKLNIKSSNVYAKPLVNYSSSSRIQILRLMAIGRGSTSLKNNSDTITFGKEDNNYVNNTLSRVRGGGSVAPKKGK